jgi:hypothetical protein
MDLSELNVITSEDRLNDNISCNLIIIDNFYENPYEVREFALQQDFIEGGIWHPGCRTTNFATIEHKELFESILSPFIEKIVRFPLINDKKCNGAFQYNTSFDKSWIHRDNYSESDNIWSAIIYLTPDAPPSAGTGFFQFLDGTMNFNDLKKTNNEHLIDKYREDITKWKTVNNAGNVFNRLILFPSSQYHMSMDYFGTDKYDSRLIQIFFFGVI